MQPRIAAVMCIRIPKIGWWSFSIAASVVWNSLPPHLHSQSIQCQHFRAGLCTHLFKEAYTDNLWEHFLKSERNWKIAIKMVGVWKKAGIAVHGTPSHSYRVSLAIWDHTVLPSTQHKWAHPPSLWPVRPVLDLPTPGGWKAELT